MKRGKKRDPRNEPYPSSISDGQRTLLTKKVFLAPLDEFEAETFFDDFERAHKKAVAASAQLSGTLLADKRFADAQASESSAQATVGTMLSAVRYLGESGVKARRVFARRQDVVFGAGDGADHRARHPRSGAYSYEQEC